MRFTAFHYLVLLAALLGAGSSSAAEVAAPVQRAKILQLLGDDHWGAAEDLLAKESSTCTHSTVTSNRFCQAWRHEALALLHAARDNPEKSAEQLKEAMQTLQRLPGDDKQTFLNNHAVGLIDTRLWSKRPISEKEFRSLLTLYDDDSDSNGFVSLSIVEKLVHLRQEVSPPLRPGQLTSLLRRIQHTLETRLPPEHPALAISLLHLADLHETAGDADLEQPLVEQALSLLMNNQGPYHSARSMALLRLANIALRRGDEQQASELMKRGLAIQENLLGIQHPALLPTLNELGVVYRNMGQYKPGEALFKRALEITMQLRGPESIESGRALLQLADILRDQGHFETARQHYLQALPLFDTQTADALHGQIGLASSLQGLGLFDQAERSQRKALAMIKPHSPSDKPVISALQALHASSVAKLEVSAAPWKESGPPTAEEILELQLRLIGLGYDPGPSNGLLTGGKTLEALNALRKELHLTKIGKLDRDNLHETGQHLPPVVAKP